MNWVQYRENADCIVRVNVVKRNPSKVRTDLLCNCEMQNFWTVMILETAPAMHIL
jgi:hypothetical protein